MIFFDLALFFTLPRFGSLPKDVASNFKLGWFKTELFQISPPLDVKEASSDALYELGKVQRRRLLFPAGKSVQVLSIVASELRPEERNVIISDLAKYKDFGCV